MKRVKKSKIDLPSTDDEDTRDSAAPLSPPVERDQIAQLATKSPRILPIFAEKQKDLQGGEANRGEAVGGDDKSEKDIDESGEETEDDKEDSESDDENEADEASGREAAEDIMRISKDSRPVLLTPITKSVRPLSLHDPRRKPLRAGSNSVESLDENYPAESPPSSGPMSPVMSSDSASRLGGVSPLNKTLTKETP